jgi:hypothetical protein
MNWTNFFRTLGFDDPTSILDPDAYSQAEIEEDLLELDLDKQHAKTMVEQKGDEYDAKLDEAAAADEWMVDPLLEEADDIEREQEDWQDEWRQLATKERLIKSVKTFRRRIDATDRDLNISGQLSDTANEEVRSELRGALKDHMRSNKQVDQLLQLFTNTRQVDRQKNGSGNKDISKHRKRMEAKQNGSRSGDTDTDDERSRNGVGADD